MGFLQHLTQFAGADLGVQLFLLLVLIQVVLIGLVMMAGKFEFLPLDDFLFDDARAGSERGTDRLSCSGLGLGACGLRRRERGFVGSLFAAAEAKQAEAAGRVRVDAVRGAAIVRVRLRRSFAGLVGIGGQDVGGLGDCLVGVGLVYGGLSGVRRKVAVFTRIACLARMLFLGIAAGKERIGFDLGVIDRDLRFGGSAGQRLLLHNQLFGLELLVQPISLVSASHHAAG